MANAVPHASLAAALSLARPVPPGETREERGGARSAGLLFTEAIPLGAALRGTSSLVQ